MSQKLTVGKIEQLSREVAPNLRGTVRVFKALLVAVTAERDRLKADFESFTGHHAATERGWARDQARLAAVRALVERLRATIDREVALTDTANRGGQHVGRSARMQRSMALELQRGLRELAACLDGQEEE